MFLWDESAGELGPDLTAETGSTPTEDPNRTVPLLSADASGRKAAAEAYTVFADGTAESARYRILGPLGEGGMGIVYRAEDTRLGRSVAIKTIPAELIADRRAKERFLNEARAASALDHPNVCTVYEIEETPAGQLYLFMPCYDGETLRDRLRRGPLPLPEALHIAQQVARGLAKAHRHGIVHCDVKPANLMLTADGVVKILDFGIARLSGQAPPVQSRPSGTPRYRSPEQARGGEVDAASDVWSLGMVLYQMVTGQLPRRNEQGKVAWEEMARGLPEAPPELAAVLSRMVADAPGDRYPHAAALLADLDRLEERLRGAAAEHRVPSRRRWLPAAGLVMLVLSLALLGRSFMVRSSGSSGKLAVVTLPRPTVGSTLVQLTDFPGRTSFPSLSPDGSTVLYVRYLGNRSHIFSQPTVRGADAIDLIADSPANDTQPAFSPDGRQIAFRSEREGGGIFLMSAKGGPVRRLTDFGFHPAWSPDGKEIACSTANIGNPRMRATDSEVFRVDVATGARRRVSRSDATQPSWSPHGLRIAYWGFQSQTGRRVIWTMTPEGGAAVPAVEDGHVNCNPVWSPDGRYLYFASDRSGIMNLWRVPIEEGSGRVRGAPEAITTSQQAAMMVSLSRDGRQIAYASDGSRSTLERVAFDPAKGAVSGPATAIVETSDVIVQNDTSPDGRWLVYELLMPREELWAVRPDGSDLRRLLSDENKNRCPQFSPDSSRIAFYSNRGAKFEIWTIGIDSRGLTQETSLPGKLVTTPLWSPDGKTLACGVDASEALIDLTRPLSERIPKFLPRLDKVAGFIAYSWSDDGRWLAGVRLLRDGSHDPGIWVYSLTDQSYVRLTSRGDNPRWLHDSLRLLYSVDDGISLLDVKMRRSQPVLAPPAGSFYRDFSLSSDDRILYLTQIIGEGNIWLFK